MENVGKGLSTGWKLETTLVTYRWPVNTLVQVAESKGGSTVVEWDLGNSSGYKRPSMGRTRTIQGDVKKIRT